MKNILIFVLLFVAFNIQAQERMVSIRQDTVIAETTIFAPGYDNTFVGAQLYSGVVGFQFTIKNVTDSLNNVKLWGTFDGTNYILVSTLADCNTGSEANYIISTTPPLYLKYKLTATAAAGDAAVVKNVIYFQKK